MVNPITDDKGVGGTDAVGSIPATPVYGLWRNTDKRKKIRNIEFCKYWRFEVLFVIEVLFIIEEM